MRAIFGLWFGMVVWGAATAVAGPMPAGDYKRPVSAECYPENALAGLGPQSGRSMKAQAATLQSWIDHCENEWKGDPQDSIFLLGQFAALDVPLRQSYLKKVMVPLKDGRRLRALLAAKPGRQARDLVVLRCGIFCDADKGSVGITSLLALFEENPVHLLLLGSGTGKQWAEDNGSSQIGGFDEGYQNLDALAWVMREQGRLGIRVKNAHVMGASLGGLSSLFSSIFYEATDEFKALPVKTFLAVCPLVDARAQFENMGSLSLSSFVFRRQLANLFSVALPFLSPVQRAMVGLEGTESFGSALDISADYYQRNWERLGFSRYLGRAQGRLSRAEILQASNVLYYRNKFSPSTLVLHATDDIIVPWQHQGKRLLPLQDKSLGVVHSSYGNHCGFGLGMGWPTYSQFLTRAFGLDRELVVKRHAVPPTAAALFAKPIFDTVVRSHYQWRVEAGRSEATLWVWQFNGHVGRCGNSKPSTANLACQQSRTLSVPLSELASLGIPGNAGDEARANRIERYLNVRTRFKTAAGALAVGVKEAPAFLESRGRFDATYGVL